MTTNERDLCTALADCIASLEHIENHYPSVHGYAMRGIRIDKARALIARVRGEEPECVYDEFSPVQLTGICHCGKGMEDHTGYDGHNPVDMAITTVPDDALFDMGHPVQDAAMIEAEAEYWKKQYEVGAIVAGMIAEERAERMARELSLCQLCCEPMEDEPGDVHVACANYENAWAEQNYLRTL